MNMWIRDILPKFIWSKNENIKQLVEGWLGHILNLWCWWMNKKKRNNRRSYLFWYQDIHYKILIFYYYYYILLILCISDANWNKQHYSFSLSFCCCYYCGFRKNTHTHTHTSYTVLHIIHTVANTFFFLIERLPGCRLLCDLPPRSNHKQKIIQKVRAKINIFLFQNIYLSHYLVSA